jgi:ABC-type dipeptide/oligopeptide/nickel transport system ATPase component
MTREKPKTSQPATKAVALKLLEQGQSITIITGPSGCGKTQNADALANFFGCSHIQDEYEIYPKKIFLPNSLVLTTHPMEVLQKQFTRAKIHTFDEAMSMLELVRTDEWFMDEITKSKRRIAELEANRINSDRHIFDCGTRHLAAERLVRIVERFGWPRNYDMLLTVDHAIDNAGPKFAHRVVPLDVHADEVPF